jgi:excisionase family DNA binding protein
MIGHGSTGEYGEDRSPLLSVNEVAGLLGVTRGTIYRRLIRDGELPAYRVGERLRFRPADVDAYLERNRTTAA